MYESFQNDSPINRKKFIGWPLVLLESGQDALRRELEKLDVGRIAPSGRVGNQIAVARARDTENGRMVFLVIARVMSCLELYRSGRSRDYPFGIVPFS